MGKQRDLARRVCARLVVAVISVFSPAASAQTTVTYRYTGNPFDVATCQGLEAGSPAFQCVSGSIAASVTFSNLTSNFTGEAALFVSSLTLTAVLGDRTVNISTSQLNRLDIRMRSYTVATDAG